MHNPIPWLMARLNEKSTWASIGLAVAAGAALSEPYSWILIGCGVVGVFANTSGKSEA